MHRHSDISVYGERTQRRIVRAVTENDTERDDSDLNHVSVIKIST